MKKVFYNSWLAKHFLPFAHTITITAFVLTKRDRLPQSTINHECTHARQWIEMAVASGLIIWVLMLVFGMSAWWMLLAAAAFYVWYLAEFAVRFIILRDRRKTYKSISFEQEARMAEHDDNYLENAHYFSWLHYLFRRSEQ